MRYFDYNIIEQYMLQNMSSSDPVHGSEHIYRVLATALEIADHGHVVYDREILIAAYVRRYDGRTIIQI